MPVVTPTSPVLTEMIYCYHMKYINLAFISFALTLVLLACSNQSLMTNPAVETPSDSVSSVQSSSSSVLDMSSSGTTWIPSSVTPQSSSTWTPSSSSPTTNPLAATLHGTITTSNTTWNRPEYCNNAAKIGDSLLLFSTVTSGDAGYPIAITRDGQSWTGPLGKIEPFYSSMDNICLSCTQGSSLAIGPWPKHNMAFCSQESMAISSSGNCTARTP